MHMESFFHQIENPIRFFLHLLNFFETIAIKLDYKMWRKTIKWHQRRQNQNLYAKTKSRTQNSQIDWQMKPKTIIPFYSGCRIELSN